MGKVRKCHEAADCFPCKAIIHGCFYCNQPEPTELLDEKCWTPRCPECRHEFINCAANNFSIELDQQAERIKELKSEMEGRLDGADEAIYQLAARSKELKERIEFAVEYLPESPHRALGFLKPVLEGE